MLASDWVGSPGIGGGSAGFSTKSVIRPVAVDGHHAEGARVPARGTAMQPTVHGGRLATWSASISVVHLVDVVAGEDDDVLGVVAVEDVLVLEHRVGRAAVPRLVDALLRRQQVDELVHLVFRNAQPRCRWRSRLWLFVLGDHADAPDARVEAVGQREIDDPELAAEVHRRFGPRVGEIAQPAAATARQHQRHGTLGEFEVVRQILPVLHRCSSGKHPAARSAAASCLHHGTIHAFRGRHGPPFDKEPTVLALSAPSTPGRPRPAAARHRRRRARRGRPRPT